MTAVTTDILDKSYGTVHALKGVSLEVENGELFGIIGPDGAGKTTLFRILTTLILPDKGTANVLGNDVVQKYKTIRNISGYMPGHFSLYQDLTVEENLRFFATVFNTTVEENRNLIDDIYVQIEPFSKRRAGALSGGMKQKLALCCALIHKPSILFLDEPTTGVDPVSRKEFWQMLGKLRQQGITILVSTPYMDEATLCDRIALMYDGNFLTVDTPQGIIDKYPEKLWAVKSNEMPSLLKQLRKTPGVTSAFAFGNVHHITVEKEMTIPRLEELFEKEYGRKITMEEITPGVEDAYMLMAGSEDE